MTKIILNEVGSPVQLRVKQEVSKKTNRPYDFLSVVMGDFEAMVFFRSPLEKKECERIIKMVESGLFEDGE